MAYLATLWMPIVLSAVLVFVASTLVHMVFKWHNPDYRKLANEDAVRDVVRAGTPQPGMYTVPHCGDMKLMRTPEFQQKFIDGPIAFITIRPNGPPTMGAALGQWFAFTLAISFLAAYVAAKALPPDATFGQVVRVTGMLSFLAYAGGSFQAGIWMGKPWGSVAKDVLDALIYSVITACTIAAFWKAG